MVASQWIFGKVVLSLWETVPLLGPRTTPQVREDLYIQHVLVITVNVCPLIVQGAKNKKAQGAIGLLSAWRTAKRPKHSHDHKTNEEEAADDDDDDEEDEEEEGEEEVLDSGDMYDSDDGDDD
jgi:hypothetical protein